MKKHFRTFWEWVSGARKHQEWCDFCAGLRRSVEQECETQRAIERLRKMEEIRCRVEPACERCRFWNMDKRGVGLPATFPDSNMWGECRRHPPAIVVVVPQKISYFPRIKGSGWCGEFEEKKA